MLSLRLSLVSVWIGVAFSLNLGKFSFNVKPVRDVKQELSTIKSNIRTLAKGTNNGVSASDDKRAAITSFVKELEKLNPTKQLSSSSLVDGKWTLVYTTNDGNSAGKLGPFVGMVEQDINWSSSSYTNYVRIFRGLVQGALVAEWEIVTRSTWRVIFRGITLSFAGIPVVKKQLNAAGTWRLTYIDDDFRILYGQGGKNIGKENIYILAKL